MSMKHTLPWRSSIGALTSATALGLGACGAPDGASDGQLSTISEAVTTQAYTDASGRIKVEIKTCDWVSGTTKNETICAKDSGWVMVGGGAEIQDQITNGALLKASAPAQDSTTSWVARSSGPSHKLRAYVIELQLDGLTEAQLQESVHLTVSAYSSQTAVVSVDMPSTYTTEMVIGGGTIVLNGNIADYFWGDAYIVASRPGTNLNTWHSAVKYQSGTGGLKSYALTMLPCPNYWDSCLIRGLQQKTGSAASGYASVSLSPSSTAAVIGIGGDAGPQGVGTRYLADLIPLNGSGQGFTVRSMAFGTAQTAGVAGYSWDLMLDQPPYYTNAIHFSEGGVPASFKRRGRRLAIAGGGRCRSRAATTCYATATPTAPAAAPTPTLPTRRTTYTSAAAVAATRSGMCSIRYRAASSSRTSAFKSALTRMASIRTPRVRSPSSHAI